MGVVGVAQRDAQGGSRGAGAGAGAAADEGEGDLCHKARDATLAAVMAHVPVAQRAAVGRQCKRVIDAARVDWLRQHGWDARLVHYVDADTSPENCLIVAAPPRPGTLSR